MASTHLPPTITMDAMQHALQISGLWTMATADVLATLTLPYTQSNSVLQGLESIHIIDASQLESLDTSGAWYLLQLYSKLIAINPSHTIVIKDLNPKAQAMYDQVVSWAKQTTISPVLHKKENQNFLVSTGEYVVNFLIDAYYFFIFVGNVLVNGFFSRAGLKDWSLRNVLVIVEQMGVSAVPIVVLLSFLIGVVLCYQMGLQLQEYNANIFIVDLSGLAILREFGPLITALIAAARTSTAFSSEIGSMKVNDELDALTTMGISPLSRLVVPKVLGLVVALPLLTILSDAAGMFGSMVMSQNLLAIHFNDFALRFRQVVELSSFWLGLVKAPVFALAIALVGCFQGFQVKFGADSVGKQTTKAAVQAIFLIIIIDAAFSVLYSMYGW
jgi:phospholipid/cholesterol/gamma-HCH transport system permease protein